MLQQHKEVSINEIEENELTRWYFVSKIFGYILPGSFPYFVYEEIARQIQKDPEYKPKEDGND